MESLPLPVESFTDEERERLAPHFTNLDRPVFGLVNLPETVKGALFARYSRYPGTLRRLFLDEFADSVPEVQAIEGAEGARAAELYDRIFAEGPGVTPDVATVVQPLHPFDRHNPADVLLEQQQADALASWGDKSCRLS